MVGRVECGLFLVSHQGFGTMWCARGKKEEETLSGVCGVQRVLRSPGSECAERVG